MIPSRILITDTDYQLDYHSPRITFGLPTDYLGLPYTERITCDIGASLHRIYQIVYWDTDVPSEILILLHWIIVISHETS